MEYDSSSGEEYSCHDYDEYESPRAPPVLSNENWKSKYGDAQVSEGQVRGSGLNCSCGNRAKLRISHTVQNPMRLFYNCSKRFDNQCEYFHWADQPQQTGDRYHDERKLLESEYRRLQAGGGKVHEGNGSQRSGWTNPRRLYAEGSLPGLEDTMRMMKISDPVPPVNQSWKADYDGADRAPGK